MSCADEVAGCSTMPSLFDSKSCRWPVAELCLKTCGECRRVAAARACMSLADECSADFCSSRVDWKSFFERVVASHEGAQVIKRERPW